ncbi:uncharacterized protein LTR77_007961 [Saxophila tyrrhenica]|uniref:Uncharacterized protein n=1 Tax=Saxophila tyrrhenica TaxID=1690608 RepID=A0AAV9P4E5_9PEZI|nr:hypothetical protein LTR77_007961 [Saxophila tyrrhenica]
MATPTMMFEFLQVGIDDCNKAVTEQGQRRTVRSQAMKDYRRRQREKKSSVMSTPELREQLSTDLLYGEFKPLDKSPRRTTSAVSRSRRQSKSDARADRRQPCSRFDGFTLPPISQLSVDPSNVYRMALVTAIADDCFMTNDSERFSNISSVLESWVAPHTMGMQAANEALALMCLGGSVKDHRIILESRKRHLAATMCLRQEISGRDFDFDSVMGSAQLILAWSAHGAHEQEGISWEEHVSGLTAIMAASMERTQTAPVHGFLMRQYRHFALMRAFIRRQRMPFDKQTFYLGEGEPDEGGYETLVRVVLGLPLLLERSMSLRNVPLSSRGRRQASKLYSQLHSIEQGLREWLDDFYITQDGVDPGESPKQHGVLAARVHMEDIPELHDNDGAGARPETIMGQRHHFSNTLNGLFHAFYWTCQLLIKQTQLDLAKSDPRHDIETEGKLLTQHANDYAAHMVRAIPFLWEAASGQTGKMFTTRGLFHFASEWYERSGNAQLLDYCQEMERNCREENKCLQWDAMLPYSFGLLYWLT